MVAVIEDLEQLVREFDLQAIVSPTSPEQFVTNLVILAILAGVLVVAWKALGILFGGGR